MPRPGSAEAGNGRDGIIAGVPVSQWKDALSRTRRTALASLGDLLGISEMDDSLWQTLESCLIQADVGASAAGAMVADVRALARSRGWRASGEAVEALKQVMIDRVSLAPAHEAAPPQPEVILLVGVNGSGKTTSAAKLAHRVKQEGRRVLLAAADTFRAAGAEQLEQWAERLGLEVVRGDDGADAASVVYRAIEQARRGSAEAVVIDTSGRMHTSHNLMAELGKIVRVADKALPGAPHQTLIVLDATTGQNGLSQARAFNQAAPASGVVLAKLDSSAKGGIGLAVAEQLALPIRYVGLGEGPDDLLPFDPEAYVEGLLADLALDTADDRLSPHQPVRDGG